MQDEPDRGVHPTSAVVALTGVPEPTLRFWEDSYGLIAPGRSADGDRVYTQDDVERIQWLKRKIMDEGLDAGVAHDQLAQQLDKIESVAAEARRQGALLILVAEKDPITAGLEEYFLDREGYDVHIVLDGRKAVEKAQALQPDLIVLDVILPGLSGLKVCKALRAEEDTKDIAILVFSVLDVRAQAIAAGADAFLLKPIDQQKLIAAVKDLLMEKRKRAQ
jgi:CheY-like chemotaxis protein